MDNELQTSIPNRDHIPLLHRWSGLIAAPFLIVSIILALGLSHARWLEWLSERLYDSLPIPQVMLNEAIKPGSWDQALKLAKLLTGKEGRVVTSRDKYTLVIQAFMEHSHDPKMMKINPHTHVTINTRTMKIVDIRDKRTSLVTMGHGLHGFRFLGLKYFSLSMASSISLLLLLITGSLLAWRERGSRVMYVKSVLWHRRLGQSTVLLLLIIVLTTLEFEFNFLGQQNQTISHPIPAVQINSPLQPGSIDQAREIVRQVTGKSPKAAYIRRHRSEVKFSEVGDGIGGQSVWMDLSTMTIKRITDWRNDKQMLMFILHDGRWLGGLNKININDAVAIALLWLVVGGIILYLSRRRYAG